MGDEGNCSGNEFASFISGLEGCELFPHLVALIARGRPVPVGDVADSAGWPAARVEACLRAQPGTEWDGDGRLVGFGLTLRPTAHRFVLAGRSLYTWCATDTLFFPMILGQDALVESACAATGRPVRLEVSHDALRSVSPPEAVVSRRHCAVLLADLRRDVCDHGHFFVSIEQGRRWTAEHEGGDVVSVGEAFDECRTGCERLGWLGAGTSGP